MEAQGFGAKLRELRQRARMTQKELAHKVGIDFTYLSKIENGVMPPPSEKVILKLAEALNADKDELMLLAGKIPSDIAQVLKNGETLQFLRSDGTRKVIRASNKIRRNVETLELLTSEGTQKMIGASNKIRRSLQMFNYNKSFPKIAIAFVLVLAVVGSLWFASPTPVKAVEATLDLPTVMYSGQLVTFYVQVDINTNEAMPINSLKVDITGTTPAWVVFDVGGNITSQSGHFVSITPVVVPYFGYGYRYGYGYGYQAPPLFTGYGYFSHWWGWGYGYGYGYGVGLPTQAKYLVVLNTTGMSLGSYKAQLSVNTGPGQKKFLSPKYSFTLAAAPAPAPAVGGGAPAVGVVTAVGSINLTLYLDAEGKTTVEIRLTSADGLVTIVIPKGTKMLDAEGNPLGSIGTTVLSTPPPPAGYALVGPAYDCRPDGATFEPAITLTFSYAPADIPTGVSEEDLVLAYWDGNEWVMLPTTVDTVANTVTADVTHFTPFGILAKLPVPPAPATFAVSSLAISPVTADIGKMVTISVRVANTGDLTGSYEVTLKINNVVVDTKDVTLDGGDRTTVIFTTTKDVAGTYTVDVNGLSGTFTVKAPLVPPAPAAFKVSQLSISPIEVQVGEEVIVSATVANTGEVEGSYTVTLKINGVTEATKKVTLAGGKSTKVTFPVVRDVAASYQVDIDGQTGSFTVTKAPLAWWIWLIVGLVVVAAIVGVVIWRRRAH